MYFSLKYNVIFFFLNPVKFCKILYFYNDYFIMDSFLITDIEKLKFILAEKKNDINSLKPALIGQNYFSFCCFLATKTAMKIFKLLHFKILSKLFVLIAIICNCFSRNQMELYVNYLMHFKSLQNIILRLEQKHIQMFWGGSTWRMFWQTWVDGYQQLEAVDLP